MKTRYAIGAALLAALLGLVPVSADELDIGGKVTLPSTIRLPKLALDQPRRIVDIEMHDIGIIPNGIFQVTATGEFTSGGGRAFLLPLSDLTGPVTGEGGTHRLRNYLMLRANPGATTVMTQLTAAVLLSKADLDKWDGVRVWGATGCMEYRWGPNPAATTPTATVCATALN